MGKIQYDFNKKIEACEERSEKKALKETCKKNQRKVMVVVVILLLATLLVLKYTPFFLGNINSIITLINPKYVIPIPTFIMPLGISFYTLEAISYLCDIYRKKIKPDYNLLRLALYLSFFPKITEGPICRYSDTAKALYDGKRSTFNNWVFGAERIAYGMLKKIVVADRLNIFITNVYKDYADKDGGIVMLAMFCYTCQLYMEFSGTMDIVIGSAEMLGIKMPENFRQPFFSCSITEFWQRWHITLGTWLRDYIFYPIIMTEPLTKLTKKARKKIGKHLGSLTSGTIALFVVWACNGLWHGSAWNYIFFGMYHFVLITLENVFDPWFETLAQKMHINRKALPYKIFQGLRTVLLVCVGELFFRAEGLRAGLVMFKNLVTNFSFSKFADGSVLKMGMDGKDYIIVGITILLVLAVSIAKEKGINIRQKIAERNIVVRYIIYVAVIVYIVIFGAYGVGYVPIDPIYANF